MLIISGTDISYSVNDSFQLTISSDSDFDSGTNAEIIIKSDETAEDVIDKRFAASGGVIEITLSESDRQKLSEGDYNIEFAKDSCYRDIPSVDSSLFAISRKLILESR